jgi:hypothetical protein
MVIMGMMLAAVWIPVYQFSGYPLPKLLSRGDV